MKPLTTIFSALLLVAPFFSAHADWKLADSQQLKAANPPNDPVALYEKTVTNDSRSVDLHLVVASAKHATLCVIDAPSEEIADLAGLMQKYRCLAGVNGGYFQPDRTPLGLVISGGELLHPRQLAPLISGIVFVANGEVRIVRASAFHRTKRVIQALQAGPFLIEHGEIIRGLNAKKRAMRTVVISEKNGDFALLNMNSVTLAEAAQILASRAIFPEIRIDAALNLDGGSSSGMWVEMKPHPFHISEIKTVRTYLGIKPKSKIKIL